MLGEVVTSVVGAGLALRGVEEWPGKDPRVPGHLVLAAEKPRRLETARNGDNGRMGIIISILLIAVGAILTWGVTAKPRASTSTRSASSS